MPGWRGRTRARGGSRCAEAIEGGDDVVESFEVVHALGAAAEFAGSLRSAKEKHADDGDFAAIEVEDFLQAVFEFR